jgi:protein-tyrosine-phosphatase
MAKPSKAARRKAMAEFCRRHGIKSRAPETPEQFAERLRRDSQLITVLSCDNRQSAPELSLNDSCESWKAEGRDHV